MSRIRKMNFVGFTATGVAILASTLFLVGCGQPPQASVTVAAPAPKAVVSTDTTTPAPAPAPVVPIAPPKNPGDINDLSFFPQEELAAIMGNYGGTLKFTDANGQDFEQPYTVSISQVTLADQPGKKFAQISFSSGNLRFQSVSMVRYFPGYFNGIGSTYSVESFSQKSQGLDSNGAVNLIFQVSLGYNKVFDPNGSTIDIVDAWSLQSVVDFYDDLEKR
ncbi:hypothetical protein WDW37_08320 [Bdellovibrionota bacterium FG-1]